MGDFDNELKGMLFKNDRKESDEDRDYSGSATINGREYWLSGWKKNSKSGTPFLSLKFKPKEAPDATSKPKAKPDFDDVVPFRYRGDAQHHHDVRRRALPFASRSTGRMIPADDIEHARAVPLEQEIARRGIKLKRAGAELIGPCPVCGGRDRFAVHIKKQCWNCRGCAAGGDIIKLVEHVDGISFKGAIETLAGNTARPVPQANGARAA